MSPEDIEKCEEKYNKAKAVHGILRHVAQSTKTPLEELYQKVGWPLYRKFGHAFDAFKKSVVDPLVIEETWKENAEGLSGVCNICLKRRIRESARSGTNIHCIHIVCVEVGVWICVHAWVYRRLRV